MEGMNIYFSGIGGVGLGPLAELAHDAGHHVLGSDSHVGLETQELEQRGISVSQDQTGEYLAYRHKQTPIDWFIYTAALPPDHPDLASTLLSAMSSSLISSTKKTSSSSPSLAPTARRRQLA